MNLLGKGAAYLDEIRSLLDKIQTTQSENIAKAAEMIVDSVSHGGAVHVMDTGHMLMHELFGRTGALMMFRPVASPWTFRTLALCARARRNPRCIWTRFLVFPSLCSIGAISSQGTC